MPRDATPRHATQRHTTSRHAMRHAAPRHAPPSSPSCGRRAFAAYVAACVQGGAIGGRSTSGFGLDSGQSSWASLEFGSSKLTAGISLRTWSGRGPSGLPACLPGLVARNPGFAMVDTRSSTDTRTVLTPSDTRRETRGWSHARRVGLRAGVIGSVWIFAFVASTRSPMDVVLDWLPWLTAIVIGAGGCYWLGSRSAPAVAKRVPNDAAPSKVHPAAYAVVIEGGPAGLQLGTLVRRRSATRRSFCTARPLACLAASLLRS